MPGWIKFFCDGTKETGYDHEIEAGKASWSKGRLDDVSHVQISNGFNVCTLEVPDTHWHQFDRFIAPVGIGEQKPARTHMVVQAQTTPSHVGYVMIYSQPTSHMLWVTISREPKTMSDNDFMRRIEARDAGRWLTLVAPSDQPPFVMFAPRGRF